MKKRITCNFAVVQFLPYPETGEFVNVGVVLTAPAVGFLKYKLETKQRKRVTDFFPEMDADLFVAGRKGFADELDRVTRLAGASDKPDGHPPLPFHQEYIKTLFRQLVRPTETLFRFSKIGTLLAESPAQALEQLFAHYVERQFAKTEEYQETVMTKRLKALLKENRLHPLYEPRTLGDDLYRVKLPFVHAENNRIERAFAPLNLGQQDTTRIIEHANLWGNRLDHLGRLEQKPEKMLFVVHTDTSDTKRTEAAKRACAALKESGVMVVHEQESEAVLAFARAG